MPTIIEYNGTVTVIPEASGIPAADSGTGGSSAATTPTANAASAASTITSVNGSTAPQTPIASGVTEIVQQGATAVQPRIAGSTLDLQHGATISGPLPFTPDAGGLLFDDSGSSLPDTVVGFTEGSDFLALAGQDTASITTVLLNANITSAGTTLIYPDGSAVYLLGVSHIDNGIFS